MLVTAVVFSLLAGFGCGVGLGNGQTTAPARISVDLRATREQQQGFGMSARVWADPHLADQPNPVVPESAQRQILSALYGRLGLTRLRPVLDSGVEEARGAPFNFARRHADEHIALVKQAKQFGLRTFFPGPVRMEGWMTESDVDAFVEWAMQMLLHWRGKGLEPPLYAPLNEPAINKDFAPEWMHQVVLRLGEQMRKAGLKTKLVIPDDENPVAAYQRAAAVLEDPLARKYVAAVAFHIYGGAEADWARLRQLASRYGLPLWMTEYSNPAWGSWPGALGWARTIDDLLTRGGVNAIDYIWGFFGDWVGPDETMIELHFDNNAYQGLTYTPIYWITGQWSRFVRPGYVRLATAGGDEDTLVTAFKGQGRLVVVAVNSGHATSLRVAIKGGRLSRRVSAVRSSAAERWVGLPAVRRLGSGFSTSLAAESVTSFVVNLAG